MREMRPRGKKNEGNARDLRGKKMREMRLRGENEAMRLRGKNEGYET